MKRFGWPLLVLGILVIAVAVVSWIIFPDWRTDPTGLFKVLGTAFAGVLLTVPKLLDYLEKWKKTFTQEKEWGQSPLKKTNPEEIRGNLGRGGTVSYINRGATDKNLLFDHNRVIIIGQIKVGKTREAAEVIDRAIEDDLVPSEQVYLPSQTLRVLEAAQLKSALKEDLDNGEKVLAFLDELARELESVEKEKWEALFDALECCSDHYVVATGRSDRLNNEHIEWLKKQGFKIVELEGFDKEKVNDLVLAAGGVFGLQFDEDARSVFVEASDGRPETTLIGMRRLEFKQVEGLAYQKTQKVDAARAEEVARDSLEAAWKKTISDLEKHEGMKYLLDAMGTFHAANVWKIKTVVFKYAMNLWQKDKHWKFRKKNALEEAFRKLKTYEILINSGVIQCPEVAVEGRVEVEEAKKWLFTYWAKDRRYWNRPLLKKIHKNREAEAWAIFSLSLNVKEEIAIQLYSLAINIWPHYWFYNNRGNLYLSSKQYKQAIENYDQALKIYPKAEMVYLNRGFSYTGLGLLKQAIKNYDQAIKLNSNNEDTFFYRGNIYAELGKYEIAIKDFDKAIQIDSTRDEFFFFRGNSYAQIGLPEKAIKNYNQAIKLNPKYSDAYINRGNSFADLEQQQEAINNYNQAINLSPEREEPYINRGSIYSSLGEHKQSIEDYDKAILINSDNVEALLNRGLKFAKIGDPEKAIRDFDQIIKLNPNHEKAYQNRGSCFVKIGQNENAIKDYNKAIQLKPDYAIAFNNRGLCYLKQKQFEKAIEDFNQTIKLIPNDAGTYYNKACTYAMMDNFDKTLFWLREVLKRDVDKGCKSVIGDYHFNNIRKQKEFVELMREFCGEE